MKKRLAMFALLLSMAVGTSSYTLAQPKGDDESNIPIVVKFKLLQVNDAQADKLRGQKTVSGDVSGKILHELELLTCTEKDSLLHLGQKWPIIYRDPRADLFQIQYVDIGAKLDVKCKSTSSGKFDIEVRPETSSVLDLKAHGNLQVYPVANDFISEAIFNGLSPKETMILGTMRGSTASRFLKAEGLESAPSNLVYTLKVERI